MRATPTQPVASSSVKGRDHIATGHEHDHGQAGRTEELHFKVQGMTCAGCSAAVQRAIERVPRVHSAAISVTEGRATVVGDEVDPNAVLKAVRDGGYEAELIDELPAPAELKSEIELHQAQHERQWKRRAIIGLSIWAP